MPWAWDTLVSVSDGQSSEALLTGLTEEEMEVMGCAVILGRPKRGQAEPCCYLQHRKSVEKAFITRTERTLAFGPNSLLHASFLLILKKG